jgi:hypothetical protein
LLPHSARSDSTGRPLAGRPERVHHGHESRASHPGSLRSPARLPPVSLP